MSCKEVLHYVISKVVSLERDRPAHWKPAWRDWLDSELRALSWPHSNGPASLEYSFYHCCLPVPRLVPAAGDESSRTLPPPGKACQGAGLRAALSGCAAGGRGVCWRTGHHLSVHGTVGPKAAPVGRDRAGCRVSPVDSRADVPAGHRSYPAWDWQQACPSLPTLDRDAPHHLWGPVSPRDPSYPFSLR